MKRFLFTFALIAIIAVGAGLADAAPADTPTAIDETALQEVVESPAAPAEPGVETRPQELFPELDHQLMSLTQAECNDYCYYQGVACMEACNGDQQCESQCAAQELQCNCDCGAIPFCP